MNSGMEALRVPCTSTDCHEYDHIVYCRAGNGMWQSEKQWREAERNICTFDPLKVAVSCLLVIRCCDPLLLLLLLLLLSDPLK